MSTILVLGATGNIGSALSVILKDRRASFAGGVPLSETGKLREQGISAAALDFDNARSLENAMQDVERLFMLLPMEERITGWAQNILSAARRAGVKFILRSSVMDADPRSPYSLFLVHGQVDRMLWESGIPCAIVHPNSFMQNYAVYYGRSIAASDAFYLAQGDGKVSFVDVRDIAAVCAAILMEPAGHVNREYDVTGAEALSNGQVARILTQVAGRRITYVPLSDGRSDETMRRAGLSDWDRDAEHSLDRHIREGKSGRVSGVVKEITGREPVPFLTFAQEYAESWQSVPVIV
ncbi:MAG: SDR family oxidoreductase [Endomicrobiales bacterium]